MEIEAIRDERSYALIARFVDGFAVGWKMAVPEIFKDALDIKLTPRFFNKKQEMLWTQGRLYDFCQGDTFYDTRTAYGNWEEALKHITLCVKIESASPSCLVSYETYETKDKELTVLHYAKNSSSEKTIDGLIIRRQRINHGTVIFRVYRPNQERTALETGEVLECTQDDFVAFLQEGVVRTKGNRLIDLFPENG